MATGGFLGDLGRPLRAWIYDVADDAWVTEFADVPTQPGFPGKIDQARRAREIRKKLREKPEPTPKEHWW